MQQQSILDCIYIRCLKWQIRSNDIMIPHDSSIMYMWTLKRNLLAKATVPKDPGYIDPTCSHMSHDLGTVTIFRLLGL